LGSSDESMLTKRQWQALFSMGRVSNLPTILSNVTVGYYLGGGQIESNPQPWLIATAAIACFYEGGMVLNAICDYSVDLRERPERPLPSGRFSKFSAVLITFFLFLSGLGLVTYFLPQAFLLSVLLMGLIVTYNLVHTQFGLAPLLMGACRGCVYLIAATVAGWSGLKSLTDFLPAPLTQIRAHGLSSVLIMALGLTLYIAAVSFIARDEVKSSWSKVQSASAFAVLGVVLWPILFAGHWDGILFVGFLPVFYWFVKTEVQLLRKKTSVPKAVGSMLAGISLWDALVLATVQSVSGMCLAWVCFGGARLWQRRIQST
jgi:4-hydroxybenzoate polyprenyltransferase